MPDGVEDRAADVWEALLAVANLAGGDWPDRARRSAVALVADASDRGQSLGVTLLRDLRAIFCDDNRLPTETILQRLHTLEESPWADLRGKPLDSRGLSRRLSKYDVHPKQLRIGEANVRGYEASDLADPWSRYLNTEDSRPLLPLAAATPATPLHTQTTVAAVALVADTPEAKADGDCHACGYPLPAALVAAGEDTHASCREVA
jgi:hypothetical protein